MIFPKKKEGARVVSQPHSHTTKECTSQLLLCYVGLPILVGLIMTFIYTNVAIITRHVIGDKLATPSLVPRPYRYRRTAWYTLFAHAFNLSNIRVKCR